MVAYLILSYTPHVDRLVAALRAGSPDAVIAVHHDDRRCPLPPVDALRIPPRPIEWGHGSQLAAVLRCLRWMRRARGLRMAGSAVRPGLSGQAGAGDRGRRCRAPTPSSRSGPSRLGPGAAAGPTNSPAAIGTAGVRSRRSIAALAARADPLAHVRTLPSGTYMGLPAEPPLPPYRGLDWFTLSRTAVDDRAGRRSRPLPAHDRADRGVRPHRPGQLLAAAERRSSPLLRASRTAPPTRGSSASGDVDAVVSSGADFARKFDDPAVSGRDRPAPNLCAAMTASILFPTHDRADYLAVALASVAPQAAEHDAEIVIVEDGAEDASDEPTGRAVRRPLRPARSVAGHQRRAQRRRRGFVRRLAVLS